MILKSSTEAECIVLCHATREEVLIKRFFNELRLNAVLIKSIALLKNNEISITLTKNVESQHQTKQIDVQYDYIQNESITEGLSISRSQDLRYWSTR